MRSDDLDPLIRRAIRREVEESRAALEGLEGRVTRRLAHPPVRQPLAARLAAALSFWRVRPQWALAGGLALLGVGILIGRMSLPGFGPPPASGANLFTVAAPGATVVTLVGDFSAWQPISLYDYDGDGVWAVTLGLPPGRYEYAFVVDGRWVGQDPSAAEHVRAFGEFVSVRYIEGDRP